MSKRATVLYVEDSLEDRDLLKRAASDAKARFELKAVAGYYEAIDYLRRHDQYADHEVFPTPDLILLDYSLGSFKGTDFLRWIRKEGEFAKLPVVVLSGTREEACVAECYAVGANYFIPKPTPFPDLVKIARCLDSCLRKTRPDLKALTGFAERPELARHDLTVELRKGMRRHQKLQKEMESRVAHLDMAMAEGKEARKRFPFARRKSGKDGPGVGGAS